MKCRTFFVWGIGFIFSCLFIWAVSAVFLNSAVPQVWDEVLNEYVRKPGITVRFRSEGWGDTRIGQHGLQAASSDVLESKTKCLLFWGDSHGEAYQVDDEDKIISVFNRESTTPLKGALVGQSGLSVVDYYYLLPHFEAAFPNVEGHVILLSGMGDVTPGYQNGCNGHFMSNPFRFEEGDCSPSPRGLRWGPLIYTFKLEFAYQVYLSIKKIVFHSDEPVDTGNKNLNVLRQKSVPPDDAWEFLLAKLKRVTKKPIIFVYFPYIPRFVNGVLDLKDSKAEEKIRFQKGCAAKGFGFIDMTDAFKTLYLQKKKLPRGFMNTPQGQGHLNAQGQALIAQALNKYLLEVGL
ncbi:hypothetical protein [Pseudodesulfovibrio piezophilus]|uniref:Uncharacterized protein n=1 Tax=Pseudodesulfovibrio piezophilus (strain DSM 21447 / JCM 15486 / C1TLV30) TaxID=1322246 RepID=M1WKN8_PSEP2|nr:hypothetical protein [Pseudodesulfovibrio piezophilus]CCH49926.1 exported protein of unknown function [Pseudodesulfovibrio piezophilus C1TLV30]